MEFDVSEIEKIFNGSRYSGDYEKDNENPPRFWLAQNIHSKLEVLNNEYSFEEICKRFSQEVERSVRVEDFEILLRKFLYDTFNRNKDAVFALFDSRPLEHGSFVDFTEEEKEILNCFINWDDSAKDQFLYNTISYCVEYCMLSSKKDVSSFRQVFNKRQFFLDTNIVLRLIGFNNAERQEVIVAFVKKCQEVGIRLACTNFTYEETILAVKAAVNEIKKTLSGGKPRSVEHYRVFAPLWGNSDFYSIYYSWSQKAGNRYDDFNSFERYVEKLIRDALKDIEYVTVADYHHRDYAVFESYSKSLENFKLSTKNAYSAKRNGIDTDTNNFMYLLDLRKNENGTTLFDIKTYFISADAALCKWSSETIPGTPICVLPSVWYAIILRFVGRTQNDYKAFNQFLTLRYRMPTAPVFRKQEVFELVQKLEEPERIKDLILGEIVSCLDDYTARDEPKQVVDKAKAGVLENEIRKAKEEYGVTLKEAEISTCEKFAEADLASIREKNINTASKEPFILMMIGIIIIAGFVVSWLAYKNDLTFLSVLLSAVSIVLAVVLGCFLPSFFYKYKYFDYEAKYQELFEEYVKKI